MKVAEPAGADKWGVSLPKSTERAAIGHEERVAAWGGNLA
jgi:hypothetical protein